MAEETLITTRDGRTQVAADVSQRTVDRERARLAGMLAPPSQGRRMKEECRVLITNHARRLCRHIRSGGKRADLPRRIPDSTVPLPTSSVLVE